MPSSGLQITRWFRYRTVSPQSNSDRKSNGSSKPLLKINSLDRTWNASDGAPVFTVNGRYTSRGWTEWTQGFQFGAEILQFDGTGEKAYLAAGCEHTIAFMAPHVSHVGVHD